MGAYARAMVDEAGAVGKLTLVQEAGPLSESVIWRVQHDFYEESGVAAWGSGEVPFQVSTGPAIALSYVHMIEGLVEDCRAGRYGPVDASSPIYVLELGAGSGRLGFQVLSILDPARLLPFRVVYVMTDGALSNVEFWSSNPRLQRFVAAGRLDFALFDPTREDHVELRRSGVVLTPGSITNPVVGVANYFFDTIPQDLFSVLDGQLYEELVEVHLDDPEVTASSPDYLKHLLLAAHRRPAGGGRYGARLDELVADAGSRAGENRRFLFPIAALAALDSVDDLADGRALWLIGERPPRPLGAVVSAAEGEPEEPFRPEREIRMGVHGRSVSFPPDVATLAAGVRTGPGGAELLLPRDPPPRFLVAALVVGDAGAASATRAAYRLAIDELLPDLVLGVIGRAVLDRGEGAGLEELISILRLSRYDPFTLVSLLPGFAKTLSAGDWFSVELAVSAFSQALRLDYPMVPHTDLGAAIAQLLVTAGEDRFAIFFFEQSLQWTAPDPAKLCALAHSHRRLGSLEQAVDMAEKALALDPSFAEAEAVLAELRTLEAPTDT